MAKKRKKTGRKKTAKKRTAKKRAAKKENAAKKAETEVIDESESDPITKSADAEQQIKMLVKKGEKKGFLTYEEMNDDLPEDAVSAVRLDR
ncbi:MAG TPA: hypothetical protein DIU00_01215, partial [Phycisphaerales bacterium]|nr:hypothetical protein [Phycisphaerales bacterium]